MPCERWSLIRRFNMSVTCAIRREFGSYLCASKDTSRSTFNGALQRFCILSVLSVCGYAASHAMRQQLGAYGATAVSLTLLGVPSG